MSQRNYFVIEGRVLYVEKPSEEGKSALVLIQTGVVRNAKAGQVRVVNKLFVRVPAYVIKRDGIENLKPNTYCSIYGRINPLVRKGSDDEMHLSSEFLAGGFGVLHVDKGVTRKEAANSMDSRWLGKGELVEYRKNSRKELADTLILKIRPTVRHKKADVMGSELIAISVRPSMRERFRGIEVGDSLNVEGRVMGLITRGPLGNSEHGENLESVVTLARVNVSSLRFYWPDLEAPQEDVDYAAPTDAEIDEDAGAYVKDVDFELEGDGEEEPEEIESDENFD